MEKEVEKDRKQDSIDSVQTQLEYFLKSMPNLEDRQLVTGDVVQVTDEYVFVDIGYKSDGRIPLEEFEEVPHVGDKVSAFLLKKEGRNGPELSKKQATSMQAWKNISSAFENKTALEGTIQKVIKGGFEVSFGGDTKAFLPISQADIQKVEDPEKLVGLKDKFFIERLYSNNRTNIVANRRMVLLNIVDVKRNEFFATHQVGDTVKGTVKSFTSFGAFVDLGGFDGLLHINDMSWGHVTRPKEFVKKGQEIELKLIKLDPEGKRINLSLKHFTDDPWVHFGEKYHVGDKVKGRVTKLTDFGAFIEIEEGIEGLAHISEFSWIKKVNKPSDMLKEGQEVDCVILGYDIQGGRVSLGLKQVTVNPWKTMDKKYPVGKKLKAKIVKITNVGVFANIEDDIDGFIHSDDISWTKKIKYPGSELKIGQKVDCVVLECNTSTCKIKLGIKQTTPNPWNEFAQTYKHGSTLTGEITSITEFGIFVKAPNGIEGLINKSNVGDDESVPYEEAIKNYKVGDKIDVYVADINVSKEKVAFSVLEYKRKKARDEISQYMSDSNNSDGGWTIGDSLKTRNK